ncbi:anti-sigma factor antagonist [Saccharothrix isguenensis]
MRQNPTYDPLDEHSVPVREASTNLAVTDAVGRPVSGCGRGVPALIEVSAFDCGEKRGSVIARARPTGVATRTGDAVVVRAVGEIDVVSAPVLAAALRAGCAAVRRPHPLVVDLTGVRLFSAAGLAVLATTKRQCLDRGVPLRVVATHRGVLRPLRVTGMDALFDVTSTLAEAIAPDPAPARGR